VKTVSVEALYERKREALALELLTTCGLQRQIESPTISNPGLALAGFTERAARGRLHVFGETEVRFLESLDEAARRVSIERFLALEIPAIVITKGQQPPAALCELAELRGVPLLRTALKTGEFYRRLHPFLEEQFAPTTTLHGSMADVYGVGLLFVGRSGIGKSECVLDLVERGHRLVADDVVLITRRGVDVLIARQHELQRHHMEIRGIGIIDITALFGIRAIRQQKRVEVVVQLEDWSAERHFDRTGLDDQHIDVLGVQLPKVIVPLNAGKNITVISEVVAMNHLLRYSGVHSARLFDEGLRERMRPVQDYLEEDYE
jgi:HPr kinase/phosphorylase